MSKIYTKIFSAFQKKRPQLAVLIDPDKFNPDLIKLCKGEAVSYFFVGGSKLHAGNIEKTVSAIKKISKVPVVIFPGDEKQISARANAILFLSLLSGRNPDYLIGKQVLAAPVIQKKRLECIATAYLLVNGNKTSVTQKVTQTKPLHALTEIRDTALAGQLLGFKMIYLEAGSGAKTHIAAQIIKAVRKSVQLPLLVGGGIDSAHKARLAIRAGADIVVVGNALERDIQLVQELSSLFK